MAVYVPAIAVVTALDRVKNRLFAVKPFGPFHDHLFAASSTGWAAKSTFVPAQALILFVKFQPPFAMLAWGFTSKGLTVNSNFVLPVHPSVSVKITSQVPSYSPPSTISFNQTTSFSEAFVPPGSV